MLLTARSAAPRSRPRWSAPALLAVVVMAGGLLGGCGIPTRTPRVVDFVQLDDRRYVRIDGDTVEKPDPATLGPAVAWTSRKVGDPEGDPLLPGDAAYLEPGTPLLAVAGFEPWFRLGVVLPDDDTALYELATRDSARTGADLLDLAPGVVEVAVEDPTARVLGTTSDPGTVTGLVDRIRALPAASGGVTAERPDLVVELRFAGGLAPVRRPVFVADRSLGDQLRLDDATLCAIEQIAARPCTAPG